MAHANHDKGMAPAGVTDADIALIERIFAGWYQPEPRIVVDTRCDYFMSHDEIARVFKTSRQYIQQLEKRALTKLLAKTTTRLGREPRSVDDIVSAWSTPHGRVLLEGTQNENDTDIQWSRSGNT